MYDKTDSIGAYGGAAMPSGASVTGTNSKPQLDQEPGWKSEFRRTLEEIKDKGFGAYADEIHERKMEELREKILASMGLSESDLEHMSPEQRNQLEKMVALEIQKRLAAEDALDANADTSQAAAGNLADQVRAAPNGLGTGVLLMQELDQAEAQLMQPVPEKKDETG